MTFSCVNALLSNNFLVFCLLGMFLQGGAPPLDPFPPTHGPPPLPPPPSTPRAGHLDVVWRHGWVSPARTGPSPRARGPTPRAQGPTPRALGPTPWAWGQLLAPGAQLLAPGAGIGGQLRIALKPHAVSQHATRHTVMSGARAIGSRARGLSPHVGTSVVDGLCPLAPPPPPSGNAAVPPPSRLHNKYLVQVTMSGMPRCFDRFALCLFALLQQLGTSDNVTRRLPHTQDGLVPSYLSSAFHGPPFLTLRLCLTYMQLGEILPLIRFPPPHGPFALCSAAPLPCLLLLVNPNGLLHTPAA